MKLGVALLALSGLRLAATAPANDACSTAQLFPEDARLYSGPFAAAGTTVGATTDTIPTCGAGNANGVWLGPFSLRTGATTSQSALLYFYPELVGATGFIRVFSGSSPSACGSSLTCVTSAVGTLASKATFVPAPATFYWVMASTSSPIAFNLEMLLSASIYSFNDDCSASPGAVAGTSSTPGLIILDSDTTFATQDTLPAVACGLSTSTIGMWWGPFYISGCAAPVTVQLDATNSPSTDPYVRVYSGTSSSCASIDTCVGANDNGFSTSTAAQFSFTPATSMTPYWIFASYVGTQRGAFRLRVFFDSSCASVSKTPSPTPLTTLTPTSTPTFSPTTISQFSFAPTSKATATPTGTAQPIMPTPAPSSKPTSTPTAAPTVQLTPLLGCFYDGGGLAADGITLQRDPTKRALPTPLANVNSKEECVAACIAQGLLFAGVEYGNQCWCGNGDYNVYGPSPGRCTSTCPNGATACGGDWAISVFLARSTYLGCYLNGGELTNNGPRALATQTADVASKGACIAQCRAGGYAYAGIEFAYQCWCGSGNYALYGTRPQSDCDFRSCTNGETGCGRGYIMAVYTTGITPTSPPTTTPTATPTTTPTATPTTATPTATPTTAAPTNTPTTLAPTATPTTGAPTRQPTNMPTNMPTSVPTFTPFAPTAAGYTPLGCYLDGGPGPDADSDRDSAQRALPHRLADASSVFACVLTCHDAGYVYAGLQYGGECWCGAASDSPGVYGPSTRCNVLCASGEKCGGAYAFNAFFINPSFTSAPTQVPTGAPTRKPRTPQPTVFVGDAPTRTPTTSKPTKKPTTSKPTKKPATSKPTRTPTLEPNR